MSELIINENEHYCDSDFQIMVRLINKLTLLELTAKMEFLFCRIIEIIRLRQSIEFSVCKGSYNWFDNLQFDY